jgi:catechol 2,3-dioxygenase-like lactoylglutathione lyase family enzyme
MLNGIKGVHHIAISVPDLKKAKDFYIDILGLEIASEFNWKKGFEMADNVTGLKDSAADSLMLRAGNTHIEIFEFKSPTPATIENSRPVCDHGYTHFAFDVVGIDTIYDRLVQAGMNFHCPPKGDTEEMGMRITYGRDPFGNVIELQEITESSSSYMKKLKHYQ